MANSAAALLEAVLLVPDGNVDVVEGIALAGCFATKAARLCTVASDVGASPATEGGIVSVLAVTEAIAVVGARVTVAVAVAVTVAADGLGLGGGLPVLPTA